MFRWSRFFLTRCSCNLSLNQARPVKETMMQVVIRWWPILLGIIAAIIPYASGDVTRIIEVLSAAVIVQIGRKVLRLSNWLFIFVAFTMATPIIAADDKSLEKILSPDGMNKCRNCDLSGAPFAVQDFSGWDFSGANFSKADLINVDFTQANLTNTKFRGALLIDVDFMGANLKGADLTYAEILGVRFCNTVMPDGSLNFTHCSYLPSFATPLVDD